jgi:archaellum component FlaC
MNEYEQVKNKYEQVTKEYEQVTKEYEWVTKEYEWVQMSDEQVLYLRCENPLVTPAKSPQFFIGPN